MLFSNKKSETNLNVLKYDDNENELFSLKKEEIYKMTSLFKYILVCV